MSVSPFSGLKMGTPSKRYVDCEISGWMETNRIKGNNKENRPNNLPLPSFPSKGQNIPPFLLQDNRRKLLTKVVKQQLLAVPQKVSKHPKCATVHFRKFPLKEQNISYQNSSQEKAEYCSSSWHCRPLTKHAFKIKDSCFKNHLTTKSIEILDKELTTNQRVTVAHIIRSRDIRLLF